MSHSGDSLGLLERQMSQLHLAIKDCSVDEQLKYEKEQAKNKKRMIYAMEKSEREEELKRLEKLATDKQQDRFDRKMQRLQDEMSAKDQTLTEKDETERANLEEKIEKRNEKQQLKEDNELLAIKNADINSSEKDRLIKDWEERKLKQETDRKLQAAKSRSDLEARIAQRRKKQREKSELIIAISTEPKQNKVKDEEKSKTHLPVPIDEHVTENTKIPKIVPNYGELVLKSGILEELESLESTLEKSVTTLTNTSNTSAAPIFIDDLPVLSTRNNTIIPPESLSAIQFVAYKYFCRQFNLLAQAFKLSDVSVIISTKISSEGNAAFMPKCYIYNNRRIIIMEDHLSSVGLLSIIAAHCASHIAAKSEFDDTDVIFKRAFFRSICLLGGNIASPTLTFDSKEILDYSKFGSNYRKQKYEEHIVMNQPANKNHVVNIKNALHEQTERLSTLGSKLEENSPKLHAPIDSPSKIDDNTVDGLYDELYKAFDAGNDELANQIQQRILACTSSE